MSRTRQTNNYCLLVRGKPCSGKSTTVKALTTIHKDFDLLDPDKIDTETKEYSEFLPRNTKNPTENVKMYCFLYDVAETRLKKEQNIIWTQPWSRMSEIELTIRNFGYHLTDMKGEVWPSTTDRIIDKLPFKFLVAELYVGNKTSTKRWKERNIDNPSEFERLIKTQKLFQPFSLPVPYIKLDGTDDVKTNADKLIKFCNSGT